MVVEDLRLLFLPLVNLHFSYSGWKWVWVIWAGTGEEAIIYLKINFWSSSSCLWAGVKLGLLKFPFTITPAKTHQKPTFISSPFILLRLKINRKTEIRKFYLGYSRRGFQSWDKTDFWAPLKQNLYHHRQYHNQTNCC